MSYRAGKLLSSGRGHSPTHSPRASGCKLASLLRPVFRSSNVERAPVACRSSVDKPPVSRVSSAERPLIVSRNCEEMLPLITQIYAAQEDLPLREFASYFNGRTRNNVPPCLTSHEGSNSRMSSVTPLYSSFQQSVKWDTKQPKRIDHPYSCRCMDCQSSRCPGEMASRSTATKNFRFKNNIMSFCDQHTMTPKVNDVSCGICLGVSMITENKGIETSLTTPKPNTKNTCNPQPELTCPRVPDMVKRPMRHSKYRRNRKMLVPDNCEDYSRRMMRRCFPEEAVRDTDPADYCYEQLEDNVNCRYPAHLPATCEEEQRCSQVTSNGEFDCVPTSLGRKTLYNEGISDDIANNLPLLCNRRESCTQLRKQCSKSSLELCCPETETWIPYSHKGSSRYHVNCKKPPEQCYRTPGACELGEFYRVMECPRRFVKKVFYSKCPDAVVYHSYATHSPRKLLTSEKNIDAFVVRGCKGEARLGC